MEQGQRRSKSKVRVHLTIYPSGSPLQSQRASACHLTTFVDEVRLSTETFSGATITSAERGGVGHMRHSEQGVNKDLLWLEVLKVWGGEKVIEEVLLQTTVMRRV